MPDRSFAFRPAVIVAVCLIAALVMLLLPPMAQNPSYHLFADHRTVLGVQNGLNVLSNLAFLAAGLYGLMRYGQASGLRLVFSAGVVLTAFGSAYYHYAPDTQTLFWDRLPMTICFMSLTALVVSERVNERVGKALLVPFLLAGAASVIYWRATEIAGAGDLRPYALVQFLPLLVLPIACVLYRSSNDVTYLRHAFCWYAAAKALELLDARVYGLGHIVSGHTLKHLASGYACWWVVRAPRNS